jgi:predicted nucleotidyltransferase
MVSFAAMKPSDALRTHRDALRQLLGHYDALHPRVFGSVVRGDDTNQSDLDLLVDPTPRTTLMTLAAMQIEAERLLGVRVEVVTPNSLPARSREAILRAAVPV